MKLKMTIEEALEFADEWSKGLTLYEGAQGWRVVCMLLAEEVRRRFGIGGELEAARRERDELQTALEGVLPFLTGEYWPGVVADAAVDRAVALVRKVGADNTALMGSNAKSEGADAASSRTLPLD